MHKRKDIECIRTGTMDNKVDTVDIRLPLKLEIHVYRSKTTDQNEFV